MLNLVAINDQLDLLPPAHGNADTFVPFADISNGHIVHLRNTIKRFAAPDAVKDLLLSAGLSHGQVAQIMVLPVDVYGNEQVLAWRNSVLFESVDVSDRLQARVVLFSE